MGDSEDEALVRQLYARHWRACELLYEHRQRRQEVVYNAVLGLLRESAAWAARDSPTYAEIHFAVRAWDTRALKRGKGWTPSRRMLLFDFLNGDGRLELTLFIGPGEQETYRKLLAIAYRHPAVFTVDQETWKGYACIYRRPILTPEEYFGEGELVLRQHLQQRWRTFQEHDLPTIDAIVKAESWLWDAGAAKG